MKLRLSAELSKTNSLSKKRAVIILRWVLVIATCSLVVFKNGNTPLATLSEIGVLLLIGSNLLLSMLSERVFESLYFDRFLSLLDVVVISSLLWLSGSVSSDFYLLYFLIIMLAAVGESLESTIGSALLIAVSYLGIAVSLGGIAAVLESDILIRIPFFFIVAVFYGYFAQVVRNERREKINYKSKWTFAKRLREAGQEMVSGLERSHVLKTLVSVQSEILSGKYVAAVGRSDKAILAEAGDRSRLSLDFEALLKGLDKRIHAKRQAEFHQEVSETLRPLVLGPEQLGPLSLIEQGFTLLPIGADWESDLYLLVNARLSEDARENAAMLIMNAGMSLNIAGQYQALVHEVEQRQAVNKQLGELLQFKSQFLANVTHEVRTPLLSFIGFCELLLANGYGSLAEEQRSVIARMLKNSQSLLQLINDMLEMSKIEANAVEIKPYAAELKDFMQDVVETCRPLLMDKPVSLSLKVAEIKGLLFLDWNLLRQILMNLVSNAVKFTPRGRIEVKANYDEQLCLLQITVKDSGVGIMPEKLEEIFLPFRQLENSYTKKYAGTGLGLAISKRQAELLEGTISVKSKLGTGSEFRLQIPVSVKSRDEFSSLSNLPN